MSASIAPAAFEALIGIRPRWGLRLLGDLFFCYVKSNIVILATMKKLMMATVFMTAACGAEPVDREWSETCVNLMLIRRALTEGQLQATTSSRLERWTGGTWIDDTRFAVPYKYNGADHRATCHVENGSVLLHYVIE